MKRREKRASGSNLGGEVLGFEVGQTVYRPCGLWSVVCCLSQKLLDGPGQLFALLCQLWGVGVDFRGVVESLIEFD